jgi:hypothetical protein
MKILLFSLDISLPPSGSSSFADALSRHGQRTLDLRKPLCLVVFPRLAGFFYLVHDHQVLAHAVQLGLLTLFALVPRCAGLGIGQRDISGLTPAEGGLWI